jgi:hypothetical protein
MESKPANLPKCGGEFETVASILENSFPSTMEAWLERVEADKILSKIPMDWVERTGHIPRLLIDLVARLRLPFPFGVEVPVSIAAEEHGRLRCEQGYSAAMLVEESRMFQVSVFETLHFNVKRIDLSTLMSDVMVIADEADSQLAQVMASYTLAASTDYRAQNSRQP